jgi:membrane protein DedA with SNARE-associated domain
MAGPGRRQWRAGLTAGDARHRWATRGCIAVLVVLTVANRVGDATGPALVVSAPLLLVFLTPQARYLLLASRTVDTVPLVVVALSRRLLTVPVVYRLGALQGTGVLSWFDRRFRRIGRMMRAIERWFGRRPIPALVAIPGGLTTFLAGDVGMPLLVVFGLTAVGTLARIAFTLWLGEVLSGPLDTTLGFISDHQWELTALTLALTVFHIVRHRHRSRQLAAGEAASPSLETLRPAEIVLPGDPAAGVRTSPGDADLIVPGDGVFGGEVV